MNMAIAFLKLYQDMETLFEPYSDEEKGRLFAALMAYVFRGEEPAFSGNERYLWPALRRHADACAENSRKQAENGKNGGRPRTEKAAETEKKPTKATESEKKRTKATESPKEKEKEQEKEQEQEQEQEKVKAEENARARARGEALRRPSRGRGAPAPEGTEAATTARELDALAEERRRLHAAATEPAALVEEKRNLQAPAAEPAALTPGGTEATDPAAAIPAAPAGKSGDLPARLAREYSLSPDAVTRQALLEDLSRYGEARLREALREACLANARERVSARFWRAFLSGPRGKKPAFDYAVRPENHRSDPAYWQSLIVNLEEGA